MLIASGYRFGEKDVLDLSMLVTLGFTTENGQSVGRQVLEGDACSLRPEVSDHNV
jgi:hypothetical protein